MDNRKTDLRLTEETIKQMSLPELMRIAKAEQDGKINIVIVENGRKTDMKKFEVGKEYCMKSICNQDCVWTYTVTARTEQTITITDGEKVQKCRISKKTSEYRNAETIYPLGQYSMAPSLTA